jgi:hypothetical protein
MSELRTSNDVEVLNVNWWLINCEVEDEYFSNNAEEMTRLGWSTPILLDTWLIGTSQVEKLETLEYNSINLEPLMEVVVERQIRCKVKLQS